MSWGCISKTKRTGFSDALDVGVSKREEARMMPATRRKDLTSFWMKETGRKRVGWWWDDQEFGMRYI